MIQTHKAGDAYVVSENGIWVPGVYDSVESAKLAARLSDEQIETHLGGIYTIYGEGRPVTLAEVETALEAVKLAGS